nr:DUF3105 domain-containing protein [Motilibacter aurantiacus]
MRREQRAAERRKTLLFVGIAAVVALALVGVGTFGFLRERANDPASKPFTDFGVAAASASCDEVISEPASGSSVHVGPGTDQPDKTTVQYASAPPTSGEHFVDWDISGRNFYTSDDVPPVERLVHNLEHGYNILWYDDSVLSDQRDVLEGLATRAAAMDEAAGKIKVVPWDTSRGEFPEGKHVAFSHWGGGEEQMGHRQYCGELSGEAFESFVKQYPRTDAPEPNAS